MLWHILYVKRFLVDLPCQTPVSFVHLSNYELWILVHLNHLSLTCFFTYCSKTCLIASYNTPEFISAVKSMKVWDRCDKFCHVNTLTWLQYNSAL